MDQIERIKPNYYLGLMLVGGFFVLVGPPLGALFMTGNLGLFVSPNLTVGVGATGYIIGWKAALATGIITGFAASRMQAGQRVYWVGAGAGALISTITISVLPMLMGEAPDGQGFAIVPIAVSGAMAAAVCTYFMRGIINQLR